MNQRVREVVTANGGTIVGEEYFPLDHADYARDRRARSMSSGAEVVFNTIVPPGVAPFLEQLHDSGFTRARRTDRLHLLRRELPEHGAGRARRGPLQLPRLLPGASAIRSAQALLAPIRRSAIPGAAKFTGGSACSGLYRGHEAVGGGRERGGLARAGRRHPGARPRRDRRGPGGPAEMVPGPAPRPHEHVHRPGQQAAGSRIVKNLGAIEPNEAAGAAPSTQTQRTRRRHLNQTMSTHEHPQPRRHDHDARNDEGGRL